MTSKLFVINLLWFLSAVLFLIPCSYAYEKPFSEAPKCMFSSSCLSFDWHQIGPAPRDSLINITFALKQKNTALLESLLNEVSDPFSPFYGKHLNHEQIGKLVALPESENEVMKWLINNHEINQYMIRVTRNKEFLTVFDVPVAKVEEIFETKFYEFASFSSKKTILRCMNYHLPLSIQDYVDFAFPTVQFPPLRIAHTFMSKYDDVANTVNPDLIKKFYNVTSKPCTNPNTTQSIFASLGQSFSPQDLMLFQKQFNISNHPVDKVIGPTKSWMCVFDPNSCAEGNLDIQYITALAENASTTFWSVPYTSSDIFMDWIMQVAQDPNPPLVHSISYGSIEIEEDPKYLNRFSSEVQKMGLRGLTIIAASGDDGVANFVARGDKSKCGFSPSFPASVPFITSVGATQGPESGQQEILCSSDQDGTITSGGGFSTVFEQPSYQKQVVNDYLQNGPDLPPTNMFNSKGRAYPDISLMGRNYELVIGTRWYIASGTSASAPVFAGMVSLINDARLNKGMSPLGWLNPLLYKLPSRVFNDITSGKNNCCAGSKESIVCCPYGFTSSAGWDPTTGFGSVNFLRLMEELTRK